MTSHRLVRFACLSFAALAFAAGCASRAGTIRGTRIPDTKENRQIIETVERYRMALERKDAPALIAMASPRYWEDGGTVKADDDYGYEGLRQVLATSLQRAEDIRYSVRYVRINRRGDVAFVYFFIDGSFTLKSRRGESRPDQKEPGQLVLERSDGKWLILAGM